MLLTLIHNLAILLILAYLFTRTNLFSQVILGKKLTIQNKIILILIFGAFSVYGSMNGVRVNSSFVNIRDLGPTIAGLIAGPVVGVCAGLIGAIYRFTLGGLTRFSCSIATVLIGFMAGLIYHFRKGKLVSISAAVMISVILQIFHMAIVLLIGLINHNFSACLEVVQKAVIPMVIANGLGMAIFIFISLNLFKERKTQYAKAHIDRELKIAHNIQMGILPKIFPPFPNHPEFDLHALIQPAREVGGDLYDFFFIDENHLCFSVGDVSGKGVSASLFMAVTKTLVKAHSNSELRPDVICEMVNRELCEENDSVMFVTLFIAIINIADGSLTYCNAGHNHPYLLPANGEIYQLKKTEGMALGVIPEARFSSKSITLHQNDTLYLYTDGINEAMDRNGNEYSYERMEQLLSEAKTLSSERLINHSLQELQKFTVNAEQSDDITMLVFTYFKNSHNEK